MTLLKGNKPSVPHPFDFLLSKGWETTDHGRLPLSSYPVYPFARLVGFSRGLLLTVAAALSSCWLCAQKSPPSAPDLNVHSLAQRVDQHYNKLHSLKAGFTESYAGLGMHREESGTLLLLKPGRMRWDYTSPPGKLFLLGHTEIEKELTRLTLKPAPNGEFTLTGQPKGQEKRIPRLALTVTRDGSITAIEIEEVDGAITSFTFTAEVPNAPVPPGAFHFTPPKGMPVIDALPPV